MVTLINQNQHGQNNFYFNFIYPTNTLFYQGIRTCNHKKLFELTHLYPVYMHTLQSLKETSLCLTCLSGLSRTSL